MKHDTNKERAQGRTLKAFACRLRGFDDDAIVHATTASKARYSFLLGVQDSYNNATFSDVSVRRAPSADMHFPELPQVAESLDRKDRDTILHMFGGGSHIPSHQWGYRDHYCGNPKDERLCRLTELGLIKGPFGVDEKGDTPGWTGAFFYLTDAGKEAARALIWEREAA